MGINGLLPQLRSITKRSNLREHSGKRAAVDAYSLLHKGSYSCAMEMVEGLPTERYVQYCMWRVHEMRDAGVEPVLVFDGGRLPNKKREEASRQSSRSEARAKARALRAAGNHSAALDAYRRAVDVTPWHARRLQDAAEQAGVSFVVAPYEADAQMALLATTGEVDLVITEDSDLLAYGCPAVLFKLDRTGTGDLVLLKDLQDNKALQLRGWDLDLFRQMCVMAGCDFLPNLPGIGVKRAYAAIRRSRCFVQAVRQLRWDGTSVPDDYLEGFQRALWTFGHQRVFCERASAAVPLTPLPEGGLAATSPVPGASELFSGDLDYLGPPIEASVARAIATGKIDPMTHQPFRPPDDLTTPLPRPVRSPWAASAPRPTSGGASWAVPATRTPGARTDCSPPGPSFRSQTASRGTLSIRDVFGGSGFTGLPRLQTEGRHAATNQNTALRFSAPRIPFSETPEKGGGLGAAGAATTRELGSGPEQGAMGAGPGASFSSQPEARTPPPSFSSQPEARAVTPRRSSSDGSVNGQLSLRRALERGVAAARARPAGPIASLPFQAPRAAKDVPPKRISPHFAKASQDPPARTASLLTMLSRKRSACLRPIELLDDEEDESAGGEGGDKTALRRRTALGASKLEKFRDKASTEVPSRDAEGDLRAERAPGKDATVLVGSATPSGLEQTPRGAPKAADGQRSNRRAPRGNGLLPPSSDTVYAARSAPSEGGQQPPLLGPVTVCSQGTSATNAAPPPDGALSDEENALPGELYAGVAGEEPPVAVHRDGSPPSVSALLPELDLCRSPLLEDAPDERTLARSRPRGRRSFVPPARASPEPASSSPFATFVFRTPPCNF